MKREPGYYWVRFEECDWELAVYTEDQTWLTCGAEWTDSDFAEIDERRIVREGKQDNDSRESGFYWVKFREKDEWGVNQEWEIMRWDSEELRWFSTHFESFTDDSYFSKIIRIVREPEVDEDLIAPI